MKIALTGDVLAVLMVTALGLALGFIITILAVVMHVSRGVSWRTGEDISEDVLQRRAATVPDTEFPEPMNRSIGGGGGVAGAVAPGDADGELAESADGETEEGPWSLPDDEAETFEIEFVKEGETVEVKENETLLEAGEDEGWDMPYACREGQCLSCSAHIPDGPAGDFVQHHNQEMLGGDELDEGYTLTCVAYPQSDHSLETRESP